MDMRQSLTIPWQQNDCLLADGWIMGSSSASRGNRTVSMFSKLLGGCKRHSKLLLLAVIVIHFIIALLVYNSFTNDVDGSGSGDARWMPAERIQGTYNPEKASSLVQNGYKNGHGIQIDEEDESRIASRYQHETKSSRILGTKKLGFEPFCDIRIKDAISALNRASSQECKEQIANISCQVQAKTLYAQHLPRYCHSKGMLTLVGPFLWLQPYLPCMKLQKVNSAIMLDVSKIPPKINCSTDTPSPWDKIAP